MQNLLEELIQLLSEDDRLISEGKLLKNKVIELALNMDAGLIKLLLKNESIKRHFFTEIDSVLVFDKIKFQKFVSNKQFLPDSYTAFKNKIGLVNENDDYLSESREVVLAWPYKDCVLEGGQTKEDQKRDEIFWNETLAPDEIDRLLAPKVFTNFKRYDKDSEHALSENEKIDFLKENLIIKGNNLLAFHSLYKQFAGKVKLIYIDPPYNTGSDSFQYNDNFNHSTWLMFMKNRLEVAKELLSTDGIIFIQIDIREQPYLKVLCDELFVKDNFLSMITLKAKAGGGVGQESFLFDICEYIIVYGKSESSNKNNIPFIKTDLEENTTNVYNKILMNMGKERKIKTLSGGNVGDIDVLEYSDFEVKNLKKEERTTENYYLHFEKIFRTTNPQGGLMQRVMPQIPQKGLVSIEYFPTKGKSAGQKYRYYFLDGSLIVWLKDSAIKEEGKSAVSKLIKNDNFWSENLHQGIANEGGVELKAGKKPEKLVSKIIEMVTKPGDILLDFHLGSGTTAAVAHKMGRQYIGIEQLDYSDNDSVVRLKNVINGDQSGISKSVCWKGGGSFIYYELMEHNEAYINRIQKEKTTNELFAIWKEMQEKAFISYKVDPKNINANISEFESLSLDEQKRFLIDVLDKNQLYVNYSEIDDEDYKISDTDKKLNRIFYGEK